jgi:membrane-anchored protein YejM (alkaline phosphatase superfamily)
MFHLKTFAKDRTSTLVTWGHWFTLFNGLLGALFASGYIFGVAGVPNTSLGWLYLCLYGGSHFIFLAFCFYLLTLFPLSLMVPASTLLRGLGALLAVLGLAALWFDVQIFQSYGIHLSPLSFDLAWLNVDEMIRGWWFIAIFLALVVLELVIANFIWKRINFLESQGYGRRISLVVLVAYISTHAMHIWADMNQYQPILTQDNFFPLSYPATAKTLMARHGFVSESSRTSTYNNHVNYPQEPLECLVTSIPRNILVIGVEGWAVEYINEGSMPFMTEYASEETQFLQHYSGGTEVNSGLFSILYALQGNYSSAINKSKYSPILQKVLKAQGYQSVYFGVTPKTIYPETMLNGFSIHTVIPEQANKYNADQQTIQAFKNWSNQQTQPWFSYVRLTAPAHYGISNDNTWYPKNTSMLKLGLNVAEQILYEAYQRSLHDLDQQLQVLIESLSPETTVVLTGVYGQVLSSSLDNFRPKLAKSVLHVPLIIHDFNRKERIIHHKTHHVGIVPTLLSQHFGCINSMATYSVGESLYQPSHKHWFYAGSRDQFAIYLDNSITVIDSRGHYSIFDIDFKQERKGFRLPVKEVLEVMNESQRFFK